MLARFVHLNLQHASPQTARHSLIQRKGMCAAHLAAMQAAAAAVTTLLPHHGAAAAASAALGPVGYHTDTLLMMAGVFPALLDLEDSWMLDQLRTALQELHAHGEVR